MLPASDLPSLTDGQHTLRVTVTNFLGAYSSAEATFTKAPAGTAPVIGIVGDRVQQFYIAQGVRLSSALVAESVCQGAVVEVRQWVF